VSSFGYINKDQATDKIVGAIWHVLEGKVHLSDAMAEKCCTVPSARTEKKSHARRARWPTASYSPIFQHPLRGVAGQLRAIAQVQLLPNAVTAGLDRLDAQVRRSPA